MMICDCKVTQTMTAGLLDQILWLKTPITADGVTVKIELTRAAQRADCLEDRAEGMRVSWHDWTPLRWIQLSAGAIGHRAEWKQP